MLKRKPYPVWIAVLLLASSLGMGVGAVETNAIGGIQSVLQIDAGGSHTCAVFTTGSLACWGSNDNGQLGIGTTRDKKRPTIVTRGVLRGETVVQVTTGGGHTCALTLSGTVACWGLNVYGQLGNGKTESRLRPIAVTGGALRGQTVVQIEAGNTHTCALTASGAVVCWGTNAYGELGLLGERNRKRPVFISRGVIVGKTITQLSLGFMHTCALASDNTIACWGANSYGELGDGTTEHRYEPTAVSLGSLTGRTITKIAIGGNNACALTSIGTVACWGYNGDGQLGQGTTIDSLIPVDLSGGATAGVVATDIAVGGAHACARLENSSVACWGLNLYGQVGNGSRTSQRRSVAINSGALAGRSVETVTLGGAHTCVIDSEESVACWGLNNEGQLGDGTRRIRTRPVATLGGR